MQPDFRDLAIQVCRVHLGLAQVPLPMPRDADFSSALVCLEAEGVHGLAAELWLGHTQHPVVRQAAAFCRLRLQRVDRELAILATTCSRNFLVFKGAALGAYLYPRGQRDCRDIDLQVAPGDRPFLELALQARGFLRDPGALDSFLLGPVQVDLHEHPLGLAERLFPLRLEEIWEQSVLVSGRLHRLSYEFEFVLGLIHSAKHGFGRLVWLLDSALLLQRMQAHRVLELVETHGLSRLLDYALWAQRELFQMEPPPGFEKMIRPWLQRSLLERWLLTMVGRRRGSDRLGRLLLVLASPRPQARWWLLRSLLWPSQVGLAGQCRRWFRLVQLLIRGEL